MPDWLDDWTDVEENTELKHTYGPNHWTRPPKPETTSVFWLSIAIVIVPAIFYMVSGGTPNSTLEAAFCFLVASMRYQMDIV